MSLDELKALLVEGTPVFYIQQDNVYACSICEISIMRFGTYLRLDDGTLLNTANFGTVAFWSMDEAEKALQKGE
jgi:hypothetical protein